MSYLTAIWAALKTAFSFMSAGKAKKERDLWKLRCVQDEQLIAFYQDERARIANVLGIDHTKIQDLPAQTSIVMQEFYERGRRHVQEETQGKLA